MKRRVALKVSRRILCNVSDRIATGETMHAIARSMVYRPSTILRMSRALLRDTARRLKELRRVAA